MIYYLESPHYFCFSLDIFERRGVTKFQIFLATFFLLRFGHLARKRGEDDQNPSNVRNFINSKIRLHKSAFRAYKNTRAGQGHLENIQQKIEFVSR